MNKFQSLIYKNLIRAWCVGDGVYYFLFRHLTEFCLHTLAVLDDIIDTKLEIAQAERFFEIFVSTILQSFLNIFFLSLGCKQNDWQMIVIRIRLDGACKFQTVHFGHHDIRYDQIEFFFLDNLQCLLTVTGNIHSIGGLE